MVNSYTKTSYIDSGNYTAPNKADILADSLLVNINDMCNKLFISYKSSKTKLDKGLLFEDFVEDTKMMISLYVPDGVLNTIPLYGADIVYWVEIFGDHTSTTIIIKFSKMQDVLANLGGIINMVTLSFTVIFSAINHYNFPFQIFTETYLNHSHLSIPDRRLAQEPSAFKVDMEFIKKSSDLKGDLSSATANYSSSTKKNFTTEIDASKVLRDKINTNIHRRYSIKLNPEVKILKKIDKVRIGVFRLLWAICRKKGDHVKAMDIVLNKINKETDFGGYLRLKEDVSLVKNIMFTTEQQIIFNSVIDFVEVYKSVYYDGSERMGFSGYLKASFEEKSVKRNKIALDEIVNKLARRFQGAPMKPGHAVLDNIPNCQPCSPEKILALSYTERYEA